MRFLILPAVLMSLCIPALGATLLVPADYSTIQAAINAAAAGDTVLVAPGTYKENIEFKGKAITVKSSDGPESTVLSGTAAASVVKFMNFEGPDSVMEGLTIRYGQGTTYQPDCIVGGGIFCLESSPTIQHNIIVGNWAYDGGGGIACLYASPMISNNTIMNNETSGLGDGGGVYLKQSSPTLHNNLIRSNWGGFGGGIRCYESSAIIRENQIVDNFADIWGGGIDCYWNCAPLIIDNDISHNYSETELGYGGGIACDTCTPTIVGNIISLNTAAYYKCHGGGIYLYDCSATIVGNNIIKNTTLGGDGGGICLLSSTFEIYGNTISGNKADNRGGGIYTDSKGRIFGNIISGNDAGQGGGMCCTSGHELLNNTIFGNSASWGGGIYFEGSPSVLSNMILWDNAASQGSEICMSNKVNIDYSDVKDGMENVLVLPGGTLGWGDGMLDADPRFIDSMNGDYHLLYPSPCRNAGNNAHIGGPVDFEGDPRISFGLVDIGADEFHPHLYYSGILSPGGYVHLWLTGLPTQPALLFLGGGVLETPLKSKWGLWYLMPPYVSLNLGVMPWKGFLEIPANIPLGSPVPFDLPMQGLVRELTNLEILEIR